MVVGSKKRRASEDDLILSQTLPNSAPRPAPSTQNENRATRSSPTAAVLHFAACLADRLFGFIQFHACTTYTTIKRRGGSTNYTISHTSIILCSAHRRRPPARTGVSESSTVAKAAHHEPEDADRRASASAAITPTPLPVGCRSSPRASTKKGPVNKTSTSVVILS